MSTTQISSQTLEINMYHPIVDHAGPTPPLPLFLIESKSLEMLNGPMSMLLLKS